MSFATFEPTLLRLFTGVRGGASRLHVLKLIEERPRNPNQLVHELGYGYKAIVHHLEILEQNGLVERERKLDYGGTFFMTEFGRTWCPAIHNMESILLDGDGQPIRNLESHRPKRNYGQESIGNGFSGWMDSETITYDADRIEDG
jgi:DNA-binding transcriptional ArsR family regulator